MVGRFILQVCTFFSLAWMDAGLMPIRHQILAHQANFIWSINRTKLEVLQEQLNYLGDLWTKSWLGLYRKIALKAGLASLRLSMNIKIKFLHSTTKSVPQPWDWFKPNINNSLASK